MSESCCKRMLVFRRWPAGWECSELARPAQSKVRYHLLLRGRVNAKIYNIVFAHEQLTNCIESLLPVCLSIPLQVGIGQQSEGSCLLDSSHTRRGPPDVIALPARTQTVGCQSQQILSHKFPLFASFKLVSIPYMVIRCDIMVICNSTCNAQ